MPDTRRGPEQGILGQIRKIKDVFYIEFYARGLLYSQIAGNDIIQAQKLLNQVEEKIARGEGLTVIRHIELPDFFDRFRPCYVHTSTPNRRHIDRAAVLSCTCSAR